MTNTEHIDWEAKYNELLEKYEFLKSTFDELARLCDSMIESKGE